MDYRGKTEYELDGITIDGECQRDKLGIKGIKRRKNQGFCNNVEEAPDSRRRNIVRIQTLPGVLPPHR
jgi:hypothetical protein